MHRLTQQLLYQACLSPFVFMAEDQDSSQRVTICVQSMWRLLLLGKRTSHAEPQL